MRTVRKIGLFLTSVCMVSTLSAAIALLPTQVQADEGTQLTYTYADVDGSAQGPVWKYMYFDNSQPAYHEMAVKNEQNIWKVDSSDSFYGGNTEYMAISAGSWMSTSYTYDSVLAFCAPKTGMIDISGTASISGSNNGVLMYVIKNNEENSVEKWYAKYDYAEGTNTTLDIKNVPVKAGDKIYFRVNAKDNDIFCDTFYLNPVVKYTELATEELPWGIFDSSFSTSQGKDNWSYLALNNSNGTYVQMNSVVNAEDYNSFGQQFYANGKPMWQYVGGDYMGIWNGEWMSTTWTYDSIIAYKAPKTGVVDIYLPWSVGANADANGVAFKVARKSGDVVNSENLINEGYVDGFVHLEQGTNGTYMLKEVEVSAGDYIYFQANPHENNISCDKLYINPVVMYKEVSDGPLEVYSYADVDGSVQGPVWKYMYFDNSKPAYHEMTVKNDQNIWKVDPSDSFYGGNTEYMAISAGSWMSTSYTYDSVLAFCAPKTGMIDISGTASISGSNNGVLMYVIKNNEENSVEKWYAKYDYAEGTNTTLDIKNIPVKAGDKIYFRVNAKDNDISSDTFYLNPIIKYTELATEELPWGIFDSSFSATQGKDNWSYLALNNSNGTYAEMDLPGVAEQYNSFGVQFYANAKPQWGVLDPGGMYMNIWNGEFMSTTWSYDSVIAYKAPFGGTVDIYLPWKTEANDASNGVAFKVLRSSGGTVKSENLINDGYVDGYVHLDQGTSGEYYIASVEVYKGDYIYFQANPHEGDISFDKLYVNPVIKYTSISANQEENVEKVSISVDSACTLKKGESFDLSIVATPSTVDLSTLVIETSDVNVATVDGSTINGVNKGSAVITITDPVSGATAQCVVVVEDATSELKVSIRDTDTGFSTEQGPIWYYYSAVEDAEGLHYSELSALPYTVFDKSESGVTVEGGKWADPAGDWNSIFPEWIHPGANSYTVLAFKAPFKGVIDVYDTIAACDTRSDGVGIRILKNNSLVFPAEGRYIHTAASAIYVKELAVESGDMLYFVVDCNENGSFDICHLTPTISYVSLDIQPGDIQVEIESTSIELEVGETYLIAPNITPEILSNIAEVTYTSSDETIAKVSYSGIITGVKAGTCTVTVSVEGVSKQMTITVLAEGNNNSSQTPSDQNSSAKTGCFGSISQVGMIAFVVLVGGVLLMKQRKNKYTN